MKLPKEFDYYLQKRVVRKISPDRYRANYLLNESKRSFEGLRERVKLLGISDLHANSIIKDSYDIIMERIRARLFLDGFSSSGNYAHEAEVSYFWKMDFSEKDVSFLNELRYFRNSIIYYGKIFDKDYAQKVFDFLERIDSKL